MLHQDTCVLVHMNYMNSVRINLYEERGIQRMTFTVKKKKPIIMNENLQSSNSNIL